MSLKKERDELMTRMNSMPYYRSSSDDLLWQDVDGIWFWDSDGANTVGLTLAELALSRGIYFELTNGYKTSSETQTKLSNLKLWSSETLGKIFPIRYNTNKTIYTFHRMEMPFIYSVILLCLCASI